ncbi:hypothetical protein [Boudabousia marimammalium]|uniref:THIF-type NAD/FAD binding fold domain-containing protein n=1 Tax=Boudabousia marimammalium TaxID=156892 RepID=A0A1Q5PLY6_9ACTO|nr:hypothetical protein [Boudabousia marimammalium]OKL48068.1 hypothetical protein BM477_06270 [Boudabousia marimammalium]
MASLKLRHGIPILQRGNGELQFGSDPVHGLVLKGLTDGEISYLLWLGRRTNRYQIERHQRCLQITDARVAELLQQLSDAGLMDSPTSHRNRPYTAEETLCSRLDGSQEGFRCRKEKHVLVVGADRLGALVASLLGTAGIGNISVKTRKENERISAAELFPFSSSSFGKKRSGAIVTTCQQYSPKINYYSVAQCDLVIMISYGAFSTVDLKLMGLQHIPHLAVSLSDLGATVGPLVQPGATPCTHCVDLHRTDHDSSWPRLQQQLISWGRNPPPGVLDAASLSLIAGVILRYATDYLDGRHLIPLGSLSYVPYYPADTTTTQVQPHPRCSCQAL